MLILVSGLNKHFQRPTCARLRTTPQISFSDDGKGVAEKFLEDEKSKNKIFELGITTTNGGSGIGLNSVREGLKSMNGTIKLIGNNVKLKGACFEIIIK